MTRDSIAMTAIIISADALAARALLHHMTVVLDLAASEPDWLWRAYDDEVRRGATGSADSFLAIATLGPNAPLNTGPRATLPRAGPYRQPPRRSTRGGSGLEGSGHPEAQRSPRYVQLRRDNPSGPGAQVCRKHNEGTCQSLCPHGRLHQCGVGGCRSTTHVSRDHPGAAKSGQ